MRLQTILFLFVLMTPAHATQRQLDAINATGGSSIAVPLVGNQFLSDTNSVSVSGKTFDGSTNTFTNIPASALATGALVGVTNGGTGLSSPGTSGNVLTSNGTSWISSPNTGSGISNLSGDVSASGTGSVVATVKGLQGVSISTVAPTSGQILQYNSTSGLWTPSVAPVSGINALTADVTASGTGSVAARVVALQGTAVSSVAPTSGQVLQYNSSSGAWTPAPAPTTGITALTSDVTASGSGSVAATVAALRGVALSTVAPTGGQVLTYNSSSSSWTPAATAITGITALTSDVVASGVGSVSATVAALRGVSLSTATPTSGQVLTYNSSTSSWTPATPAATGITALTGDVIASGSGSVTSTVAQLQGTPVSSTPPTNGQFLEYNSTSGFWTPSTVAAGGQWATSGSNIYNTNSGNVGIGTSSPGQALHVVKTSGNASIVIEGQDSNGNLGELRFFDASVTPGTYAGNYIRGVYGGSVSLGGAHSIDFYPNSSSTSYVHFDSSGSVGIGIGAVTPAAMLEVNGSAQIDGALNVQSNQIHSVANGTASTDAVNLSQLSAYIPLSEAGANNGVATLNSSGQLTSSQLPTSIPGSSITGNITGTASNITATTNSTLTTLSALALPYSQLTGSVPTWNQNTTGTASNITATTNSTLTTLSALSLPGSQVTGNISGSAGSLSGTVAIANGGTGQTTQQTALNALAGSVASGSYLRGNGTNVLMSTIQAGDVPTLNQNTTGTASNITATSNSTLTTLSALSLPGSQVTGNISGNAANVTATTNSTLTTLSALSLPYSQLSGTVPTWNQNTTGTAANITATSNSTLTTLSALSLPGSQVTGNISGNAANVTATSNSTLTTLSALSLPGSQVTGNISGNAANITATSNSTLTTLSALSLPGSQVTGNISGNAANVTGTVAVGNGGTGLTTLTSGSVLIGNGTSAVSLVAPGTSGNVLQSNGSTWVSASSTTVPIMTLSKWNEFGNAPTVGTNGQNGAFYYDWSNGAGQSLYAMVTVPSTYTAGTQIKLRMKFYSTSYASGYDLMQTVSTLIRTGTDAITSTTNQRTSTVGNVTPAGALVPYLEAFDLTDSSGNVNSVAVSPGDTLLVQLTRSTDTDASDIRGLTDGCEVLF